MIWSILLVVLVCAGPYLAVKGWRTLGVFMQKRALAAACDAWPVGSFCIVESEHVRGTGHVASHLANGELVVRMNGTGMHVVVELSEVRRYV